MKMFLKYAGILHVVCVSVIMLCLPLTAQAGFFGDLTKDLKQELKKVERETLKPFKDLLNGSEQEPTPPKPQAKKKATSKTPLRVSNAQPNGYESEILTAPADIKTAQTYLKELGYEPGAADGVMGQRTRNALKMFQKAERLPVTGQLDRRTFIALRKAVEALRAGKRRPVGHGGGGVSGNTSSAHNKPPTKPVDQSPAELKSGAFLSTNAVHNLLNGNTAYMTFQPAGNTTILHFSLDGKAIAKNPDSVAFHVGNWKVSKNQWCMVTNGPTVCYKLKLKGDTVEAWHKENSKRIKSVTFKMLDGDSANLVFKRQQRLKRNSDFIEAARNAGVLLLGTALLSTIVGDSGSSSGQLNCASGFVESNGRCEQRLNH